MSTRREFFTLLPIAGAAMISGCGGGGSSPETATRQASPVPDPAPVPAPVPAPQEDKVPAFVVVEDWSSGAGVDAGRIDFGSLIRQDSFADAALAADCKGWTEHGPTALTNLPVLNGVQFSAKRYTIEPGGRYSTKSYRVQVYMRALGLVDGLFGDVRGVKTFPGPHKLRIVNAAGVELQRIEMRDGLPINHASLINVPFDWTVTARPTGIVMPSVTGSYVPRLPKDKPMRPHMSAGSTYVAFFGDAVESSASTRSRIPRVRTDLWPSKNSKSRAIYNGFDVHVWGGNGFNHPEVMPQWAMSENEATAVSVVAPNDPEIQVPYGYNWVAAMVEGWGYEPGALGGITRRSGPGGVRPDRTVLPSEFFQMALSQTTRTGDGVATAAIARGHALNHANYPGYYPKDMLSLDAINTYSDAPQPTVSGRAITPILHYYGGNHRGRPEEVWICDTYGDSFVGIAQAIEFSSPGEGLTRSNGSHIRNGWMPDSEHNCRVGNAWATLLYADPMFARMAEHLMLESVIFVPVVARGTWNLYGGSAANMAKEPGSFWQSRSNVLPFCGAAMMWWVATNNGVYTRAVIEERLHMFFKTWKSQVLDIMPAPDVANSPTTKAFEMTGGLTVTWDTWSGNGNHAPGSGWVASFGIFSLYLGQLMLLMKCSGLLEVLQRDPTTALCLSHLDRQLAFQARVAAAAPWAVRCDRGGSPAIILRSEAQGGVAGDFRTIPTTVDQVLGYNPARRSDGYWFLADGAVPGVASALQGNYAYYGRFQSALLWLDYLAAASSERTAAKTAIEGHLANLSAYTPTVRDPAFTRHNFVQVVPGL